MRTRVLIRREFPYVSGMSVYVRTFFFLFSDFFLHLQKFLLNPHHFRFFPSFYKSRIHRFNSSLHSHSTWVKRKLTSTCKCFVCFSCFCFFRCDSDSFLLVSLSATSTLASPRLLDISSTNAAVSISEPSRRCVFCVFSPDFD